MIPPEFLQPDELFALTGNRQHAAWRRWLDRIGVRYVQTPRGFPLVYRHSLSPTQPESVLNLEALHARRKTAKA